jgi:hypothetical protein
MVVVVREGQFGAGSKEGFVYAQACYGELETERLRVGGCARTCEAVDS